MIHAGLDLSRKKLDVCLLSDAGELVGEFPVPPDADGLRGLVRRVGPQPVQAVVESMTGARFVHDRLEELGWEVLIADAAKVKGLAPLACKTDRIDARVLAVLSQRDLVPEIWLPDPRVRAERELARYRMHLVKHRSMLKSRIHSTLITFGRPCGVPPVSWTPDRCAEWRSREDVQQCPRRRRMTRSSAARQSGC
jgi:transposase